MRPVSPFALPPAPPTPLAQVGQAARRLVASALRPPACAACDAPREDPRSPFCQACTSTALPLGAGVSAGERSTLAAFLYAGAVARAVVRVKSERRADLVRLLGDLLWGALGTQLARIGRAVVVPVPLHPARLAERGFNQSGVLAGRVARRLGSPLWPSALSRTRDSPPQATLRREARMANVSGAFVAREPEHIRGRSILLIDDVCTSGATLDACARTLLDAGASSVHRAVLARAGY
jgi:ComF family protein